MSTVINVTGVTPTPIIINGVGTVQQIIATGVITQRGEQGVPGPTGPAGTTDFNLLTNKPTLGTSAAKDIPATGNASAIEVVYGTDTRLTDSRQASDVSAWAKAPTKPTYTNTEVGAAATVHTHAISDTTGLQTSLDGKVDENVAITGATKTKITYDAKGLVTAGADATTADIADSTNKRYVTDANLTVIGNTSGTNTGDNATNSQYSGLAASKQDKDATLTSLAAYNTNGLLTQTAADTFTGRTITGTTNQISVTNGDGVSGNPTLSLPQDIHTGASPTFNSLVLSTYGGIYNGAQKVFEIGSWGTPTNGLGMEAAPTGNGATLYTTGDDTNIDLNLTTKGSGAISANANTHPGVDSTYTLGTSSAYWSNTYTDRLYLNSTAYLDGSTAGQLKVSGLFMPVQAATASAPTYVKGAMYFDTTLNKLRIGGATGWETVTSS